MARMAKVLADSRKSKLGTTVLDSTLEKLKRFQEKRPDEIRSTGEAIDYVCDMTLDMDPRLAKELLAFCASRVKTYGVQLGSFNVSETDGYAFAETNRMLATYSKFVDFLGGYCESEKLVNAPMARVDLKDGDYFVCPDSWPILNEYDAPYCSFVVVIEIAGGGNYDAPHFVYLKSDDGYITDKEKGEALDLAKSMWPGMIRVLEDEVPLVCDSAGKPLNEDEHLKAPIVCYFRMPEASECSRKEDAPYGAMIFRA